MENKTVYFPGLNTIRFLAAFMVVISHIVGFKTMFNLPMPTLISNLKMVEHLGRLGVILFFVLSGFLITYLLLVEKEEFNSIAIRKFYYRRILRIWPLYYLLLILSLFIFPNITGMQMPRADWLTRDGITIGVVLLSVFFMSNIATVVFPKIPYFYCTWSVGVEEQFYLIWPFVIKKCKNIPLAFFLIIFIYLSIKNVAFPLLKFKMHFWNNNMNLFKWIWNDFLIDTMAIGGLFAYMYHKKSTILHFFYKPVVFILSVLIAGYFFVKQISIPFFLDEIFAILFAIVILNISTNKTGFKLFNMSFLDYLGKISYGIYMYHSLCIVLTIKIMTSLNIYSNLFYFIVSIFITIGISALSYKYFEKYFLSWKNKFSVIHSTNSK